MSEDLEQKAVTEEEPPGLSLTGLLADQIYVLRTSQMTLITTFAQSNKTGRVLLPLADWQILGNAVVDDQEPEVAFEALLPLDNIAFLLKDMSGEFCEAVENLEALRLGATDLSHMDTTLMRNWLREVVERAEATIACLDRIGQAKH